MFKTLKKLTYGIRVMLSKGGGEPETIEVVGRPTVIKHAGAGTPFVYLHSALDESAMWLPFYQSWARQFRVLVPTHPGFGLSGGLDGIDAIEDMAFHYVELFDALGLDEVILGGVSLGGWIAAEFAVRWPERVKKLWLADAPGLWIEESPLPDLFRIMNDRERLRELLFHDPQGAMASLVISDQPDEATMMQAYQSLSVLARLVWERPYNPKLAGRLHRIGCPTLLVWGEHDRLVPPAYGEAYHKHIRGSELKLIKDCGHLPMFEKEAEFVEMIARFCRD
ncbi:MAG: alpha/beta hydrolase [Planctomycetes bacterium]|nr:alpha/beta hydrolase [Planctomycetota bacterium]